jgi:hypothetical protein
MCVTKEQSHGQVRVIPDNEDSYIEMRDITCGQMTVVQMDSHQTGIIHWRCSCGRNASADITRISDSTITIRYIRNVNTFNRIRN